MLKRQRQQSPPPSLASSSNIPFVADPISVDTDERNTKRRRTQPPVLDGTQRGWPRVENSDAYDDAEEYWDGVDDTGTTHDVDHPTAISSDEYKATNSMLRELHTLHQHRVLFSSQSSSCLPSTHSFPSNLSYGSALPSHSVPKCCPVPLEPSLPHVYQLPTQKPGVHRQGEISEEAGVVSERYENINRLLGSLFLSRRRVLDSSSPIPNAS